MSRSKRKAGLSTSKLVVVAALVGNLLVAVTKFVAAAVSGSASMLSEALHSLIDTTNEVLLLYGMHRANRAPDATHPLGHGRELYFWSFVVAVLLFALGACASVAQGVHRVLHPEPIENAHVVYVVLAFSFAFEAVSWRISQKAFARAKGGLGYWEAFRRSKDPPTFLVLFEDTAALVGIAIAALGTYAAEALRLPLLDGVASIGIGVVLALTSLLLAQESKELLIGERADPVVGDAITALAAQEPGVLDANGILTVQLAPNQIVVALSLEFDDALRTPQIERAVVAIERRVRAAHPEVLALFVKPQSRGGFERSRETLRHESPPAVRPDDTEAPVPAAASALTASGSPTRPTATPVVPN